MPSSSTESEGGAPSWILHVPLEKNLVYGVGSSTDYTEAHLKSITDISFQLSVHVKEVLVDRTNSNISANITASLEEQFSATTIQGAKILDEYTAENGEIFVLSRLHLDCVLDITESVLISFEFELKLKDVNIDTLINTVQKRLQTKRVTVESVINPQEMIFVEQGVFYMGSAQDNLNIEEIEQSEHQITINPFYIKSTEIRQREWEQVMGYNPSYFKDENKPVERVSWYEAIEFCNKLSKLEGLDPVYTINGQVIIPNWEANGYRLPTEAEWEYAAKGGPFSKDFIYAGSNFIEEVSWNIDNASQNTNIVGQKKPNELGLYDMSGNIYEWTWDWLENYSSVPLDNPHGPKEGDFRVLRGGSWENEITYLRITSRNGNPPSHKNYDVGFRIVKSR